MRGWVGAWAVGAWVVAGCGAPVESEEPQQRTGTPTVQEPAAPSTPAPTTPAPTTPSPPTSTTPPTLPDPTPPAQTPGPGPWPEDALVNYSTRFGLGSTLQGVAVDDAYNIWLLDGDSIGVLRPGDSTARWTRGVGQAAGGFGYDQRALGSSVICGGSAGRAYVGYTTYELDNAFIYSADGSSFPNYNDADPTRYDANRYAEYLKGDLDVVMVGADGQVRLEEHLSRSARSNGPKDIGIRNTNDHHFDEDRSVFSCVKVMRGQHRGDVYIGTNHGVTRVRGLEYNSHRHPVWFKPKPDGGETQMAGYTYGLGIGQNGDVLIGNDWNLGVVTPSVALADWDRVNESLNQDKLNSFLPELNSQEDKDFWRSVQQTTAGAYYAASRDFGLWNFSFARRSEAHGTKVMGLPTDVIPSIAATDDGSLYIATRGFGLWKLDAQQKLTHVDGVEGTSVTQLVYDPTVKPSMLYVLTDAGLTVLRGP